MATARVPMEELNANPTIVINPGFVPSPEACMVSGTGQMSVTFTNNSGGTMQINFVPPARSQDPILFTNITTFPNTQYVAAGTNASVNYTITANGVTSDPYCIQINDGPMYVQLSMSNNQVVCTPVTVAVPETTTQTDGTLAISPAISTDSYPITWDNGNDPFNPEIKKSDGQPHASNPGTAGNSYGYTAGPPSIRVTGGGGGTVIIRSA